MCDHVCACVRAFLDLNRTILRIITQQTSWPRYGAPLSITWDVTESNKDPLWTHKFDPQKCDVCFQRSTLIGGDNSAGHGGAYCCCKSAGRWSLVSILHWRQPQHWLSVLVPAGEAAKHSTWAGLKNRLTTWKKRRICRILVADQGRTNHPLPWLRLANRLHT